jgi:hypothetical protein
MVGAARPEAAQSELNRQITELRIVSDTLERERNFYYLKLRDLEVMVLERLEKVCTFSSTFFQ